MSSSTNIESSNPAEAIDPIEAIKAKILKAVREVPLITNQVGWNALLNSGVISLDEMIKIKNNFARYTSALQQSKWFHFLISFIASLTLFFLPLLSGKVS